MRQFDVCRLRDGRDNLVVILQNDIADELETRIVAPLSDRPYRRLIEKLRLPVDFGRGPYVVHIDRMAAIPTRSIGVVIGSLADSERHIKNALDLVFFGV